MYEAVLFDVDDTLCRYRRSAGEVLTAAFEQVGVDPYFDATAYYDRYAEFVDETEDVRELRRECFAAISADAGRDPDVGRAVARAFAAERDHTNVEPLPGALDAVETVARDHRVGVVTNGAPAMQSAKLRGIGLADAFETVVHAGYDARAKPDPEPFEHALTELGTSAERAVHVGNSLSSDVAGAHAAGVASAWLAADADESVDPTPTYTLGSMQDLTRPPWRER